MCLSPRIEESLSDSENTLDLGYPIDNCDYYDLEDTTKLLIDNSDLVCVQWNTRGLISKQAELSNFLFDCLGKRKVDVVIISETWVTKTSEKKVKIPGYHFVGAHRHGKRGGGVGFLISEELKYIVRDDLLLTEDHFENCTIEIISPKRNILIGSIYRPPNTNDKSFVENFDKYITNLSEPKQYQKKDIILGLDHNLDLLKNHRHLATQQFLEKLADLNMLPTIVKPTRITKSSATLIDNIIISRNQIGNFRSCIINSDMSDHMPCMCVVDNILNTCREPKSIISRNLKPENVKILENQISNIQLDPTEMDVNKLFESLHQQLTSIIDETCPEREITIPIKRIIREPWMTNSLRKCAKKQQLLYKNFIKYRSDQSESKYKNYRNTLKKIKRFCKVDYYRSRCLEFRQNTKKLWGIINEINGKVHDKSSLVEYLKIDNLKNYDSKNISNEFGKYFATLGKTYASKIETSNINVTDYISKIQKQSSSLFLTPCTVGEVNKILINLPNKNSSGYDNISNKLLKQIQTSISPHLCKVFNVSLTTGAFPDLMKHAEVIPLYKSGEKCLVVNYRPISLLITISKILEKVIYKRTYEFLSGNGSLYRSQYGFRKKHS